MAAAQTSTYNKAFAIRDWFENGDGRTLQPEDVVVLLDGDMILTQALDSPALSDHDAIMGVRPGKPLSQVCSRAPCDSRATRAHSAPLRSLAARARPSLLGA